MHTGAGVVPTYLGPDNENERTAELTRKCVVFLSPRVVAFTTRNRMDIMLQLFREFATPQEREISAMVKKFGGNTVIENEQAMEELAAFALSGAQSTRKAPDGRPFGFYELQQEIKSDPDETIEKNAEFFNRKFDIQRRQIVEDIARTVNREGDRIISAVTAGPHDRIFDPVRFEVFGSYVNWTSSVSLRISMRSGRRW